MAVNILSTAEKNMARKARVLIVTRHKALVRYLKRLGIEGDVLEHATLRDVQGNIVYGVLPFYLASKCLFFTEVSLTLTPEQRGRELTFEELCEANPRLTTYRVTVAPVAVTPKDWEA